MRRLAAAIVALLIAAPATALAISSGAQGSSTVRFDVIFDDAHGLVAGQLVKIAGANAGTIENVVVTPDFKARIEATVEGRFMPFHRDATCEIRPQGLIAENYVDCDPGTPDSPPLTPSNGHPPTVPVSNTTEPVSLLNLFNMFNLPTRERLTLLVNELGIATAARGTDLNSILLRANPALAETRKVLSILADQSAELKTIVDATNTIAAQGAGHTASVQGFLDQTAALTTLTAQHRGAISQAVARLPGMLAAAQPALSQLDTVAVDGTPLVQQLHAAVPALNRVSSDLGPFVAAANPGLAKLNAALTTAIPAIRRTTPLVQTLSAYASRSLPATRLSARLFKNLQSHGFVENFLSVAYYIGASLARFDSTSHMLPLLLVAADNGACGNYATTPIPACSAHYGSHTPYKPSPAMAQEANGPMFGAAAGQTQSPPTHGIGSLKPAPEPGNSAGNPAGNPSRPQAPASSSATPPSRPSSPVQRSLQALADYLLK